MAKRGKTEEGSQSRTQGERENRTHQKEQQLTLYDNTNRITITNVYVCFSLLPLEREFDNQLCYKLTYLFPGVHYNFKTGYK